MCSKTIAFLNISYRIYFWYNSFLLYNYNKLNKKLLRKGEFDISFTLLLFCFGIKFEQHTVTSDQIWNMLSDIL